MSIRPNSIEELEDLITRPSQEVVETVRSMSGPMAVLGAGGKMGFHVSRMLQRGLQLAGRDDPVIAVSRFHDSEKRNLFESFGFAVTVADLSDPSEVEHLPDADHVFFLAGVKFGTASQPKLLQRMNVEMPGIVAERYRKSRIVALSTGCVYAFVSPESGGSTEQSPTNPPGEYAQSCLGREQAFVANSAAHGTPTCLIRLNYSNELRYGVLVDIASRVFSGEELSVSTGYVNVIWQGDAVEHIIRSLPHAKSPPFILNVTGPETLSVRELAWEFGKRFGKEPRLTGQEASTAWLNNAALAHQLLGAPRMPLDRMIDWIAEWVESGGQTLNKPTRFEVRDGDY